MNFTTLFFLFVLGTGAVQTAGATTITVSPSTQTIAIGSPFSVDLYISGLGSGGPPSLGTFDLSLGFDSAILAFASASFGSQLDILGLGSLQFATPGSGTVNLFELSLDSIDDLNNLQLDSFALATLTFDTVGIGTSALTLNLNALGDAEAQSLSATLQNGFATVQDGASPVPEPHYLVPLGCFLLTVTFRRRIWPKG